jgi:hypothetical protein
LPGFDASDLLRTDLEVEQDGASDAVVEPPDGDDSDLPERDGVSDSTDRGETGTDVETDFTDTDVEVDVADAPIDTPNDRSDAADVSRDEDAIDLRPEADRDVEVDADRDVEVDADRDVEVDADRDVEVDADPDVDSCEPNDDCVFGIGACEVPGDWVCDDSPEGGICSGEPGPPQPGLCNGVDDDCDGPIDEGGIFETFEFSMDPTGNGAVAVLDVEGVRVGSTIFAYVQYLPDAGGGKLARLVRFDENGEDFEMAEFEESCDSNPQIAANNHVVVVACDRHALDLTASLYYWPTLERITQLNFLEGADSSRQFRNIDLGIFAGTPADETLDALIDVTSLFFTYQQTISRGSTVVLASFLPASEGLGTLDFIEVSGSSAPSVALNGPIGDGVGTLIHSYFSASSDELVVVERDFETLDEIGRRSTDVAGDPCAGMYGSETHWVTQGSEALVAFTTARRVEGECPAASGSMNTSVLYAWDEETLSFLAEASASRAELAVDPARTDGAWIRIPAGAATLDYSYLVDAETEARQSNDMTRAVRDILPTSSYFMLLSPAGDMLQADVLACD